jgi:hypothetical protein
VVDGKKKRHKGDWWSAMKTKLKATREGESGEFRGRQTMRGKRAEVEGCEREWVKEQRECLRCGVPFFFLFPCVLL